MQPLGWKCEWGSASTPATYCKVVLVSWNAYLKVMISTFFGGATGLKFRVDYKSSFRVIVLLPQNFHDLSSFALVKRKSFMFGAFHSLFFYLPDMCP